MIDNGWTDPKSVANVDASTAPNVLTTAGGVQALPGDGNRIGVWISLVVATVLTAVQYVCIGVKEGGQLRALAAINVNEPYCYLGVDRYGSVIQEPLFVFGPDAQTTISVGSLRNTGTQVL